MHVYVRMCVCVRAGPPVVACAPLLASETIVLTQQQEEEITISQTSPFEDTVIASSAPREMVRLWGMGRKGREGGDGDVGSLSAHTLKELTGFERKKS